MDDLTETALALNLRHIREENNYSLDIADKLASAKACSGR